MYPRVFEGKKWMRELFLIISYFAEGERFAFKFVNFSDLEQVLFFCLLALCLH